MSFTKRLCECYKKLKTSVKRDNFLNNEIKISSWIYLLISMVWRSMHHKEILLSEPGRNTNVGENAFIPELPLYVDKMCIWWELKIDWK